MKTGLYVHVPCCIQKCSYCDFYSHAMRDEYAREYVQALALELAGLPDGFSPATIYIGGGTPTALPDDVFSNMLECILTSIDTTNLIEWTCEANPGVLADLKISKMLDVGINRVSLGIQTFNRDLLKLLGRIHTAEHACGTFERLRSAGFENISLDLMYALPGGSRDQVCSDIEQMIALKPEHISCYCLSFEGGTELARLRDEKQLPPVSDEEAFEQYELIRHTLQQAEFIHYELSNYARSGRECLHNLLYWEGGEYFGCGPAAHSHWDHERFSNIADTELYIRNILSGASAVDFREHLPPEEKAREALVMELRKIDGVSGDEFLEKTGFDYYKLRGGEIRQLCSDGLLDDAHGRLRLTERALFISNQVFSELV